MSMTLQEPKITKELIAVHGITDAEFERICSLLGREPNFTELGIFSVMWSEHCSYKNSRPVLKLFAQATQATSNSKRLLVKAGDENAGVVDIGDGLAICFKIESHNHPSAVEPFQGAATGMGGIIRDIFTMGARPILGMNSLRFGNLDKAKNKNYLRGVVGGIAHYGNCIGIPTIGGEIYFDEFYEGNPLVNAMCLGIMRKSDLMKGSASGTGNPVYYVGATTGRDGLGGAAFASRCLTEESHEDRPAVQVGDPFMEKLLMEACLELAQSGAIVGMQDMGAAGLTCSTCETASRGNSGIRIDINKVPRRETGMIPYEVMLSESQERMLVIVKKGKEKTVEDIFKKWDLHSVQLGEVADGSMMRIFEDQKLTAEIPAKALTDEAPVYEREIKKPGFLEEAQTLDLSKIPEPKDYNQVLLKLLDHPTIASKAWIYEQYDHMVRTDTVFLPGHDAALVRIKGMQKGIAISTDCNALYTYLDPFEGGKIAVAEAARNVACSGARPIGMTNCLNFGNPMKPEIFWQFRRAVEGMCEAVQTLDTPVTGGNVSFYNENPTGAIYPTPTVGVVGILENIELRVPSFFQNAGDIIYLLGTTLNELGGSQYLLLEYGLRRGLPPRLDLQTEKALQDFLIACAGKRFFKSCHDISDGGFSVALSECLLGRAGKPLGASVNIRNITPSPISSPPQRGRGESGEDTKSFFLSPLGRGQGEGVLRTDALLFGESQSRAIVSVVPNQTASFEQFAGERGVPFSKIGKVTKTRLVIDSLIDLDSNVIEKTYREAIPGRMK